jgi:hypothetical protein
VSIHFAQHLPAPKFIEAANPGSYLKLIARFTDVRDVDRQDISAIDVVNVAMSALGAIFSGDVVG